METKYITHQEGETFVIYDARLVKKKPWVRFRKRLGFLCLGISLVAFFIFLSPILTAELKYRFNQLAFQRKNISSNESEKPLSRFGQLLWLDKKGIISPNNWEFSLIIPKIQINANVESSVHPGNEGEYETALKTGVAHAKGTAFPNQSGTVYIFGHSTDYPWNISRYSAYFYTLKYLGEGEEIIIIYQGKNYLYKVKEKTIAEAQELEYLISSEGEKKLVLQTCWPPGTTWKRLLVVATPIEET